MLYIIFLLTQAASFGGASLRSCKLLKNPLEMLKCEVEEILKENHLLKMSIEQNTKAVDIHSQVLEEMSNVDAGLSSRCTPNACGPCACYTDYQLSKKYYCNCENLEPMRDCLEFRDKGYNVSGLYLVNMRNIKTMEVFCDQDTDGGGWTVIQRRLNGQTNFYRGWSSYKEGFGNPQREFWLGNENIYLLTYQGEYPKGSELRIDMEDWADKKYLAKYTKFLLDNEEEKYKLHVSGFTGDAGDSLTGHDGHMFSTYDEDNDVAGGNCATTYHGAWWYTSCHSSNLNGEYRWYGETVPYARGVIWRTYKDYYYSMKFVEMKVRRKD